MTVFGIVVIAGLILVGLLVWGIAALVKRN